MDEIDPQRYVLPALLALLFLGAFVILVTSGGGEQADTDLRPVRSTPAPANATPTTPATATHSFVKVQPGDTPTSIAEAAGMSVDRLLELNPSVDPGSLRAGQTLKIAP